MPLKSLTINGFKSFADKTTIEFTSGITGIVGPNGSGKSNITEAIRWVMGEQSAKSLRGAHMPDVIFAGSALRPPLNRAEVILVFDNSDQTLKTDQKAVEITRRLYRDGSSEFLFNHQSCRLRDITDLFVDSGLGKEAFAIISQGRVEQVFNSKPEDRRTIIEEAAGVFKYKQQKRQAENELATTNENLNRLADIVSELAGRVEPLRKQASLARDYQQQKSKFDGLNQQVLALELADLEVQQEAKVQRQNELTAISAKIDAETVRVSEQLTEQRNRSETLNQEIETQQAALMQQTHQQETLNGKLTLSKERENYHQLNSQTIKKQLQDNQTALDQGLQKLADQQKTLDQAADKRAELVAQLAELQKSQGEDEEDLAKKINDLRADYIEQLQGQTTNRNEIVFAQDNLKKLTQQAERTAADLQAIQEQAAAKQHDVDQESAKISAAKATAATQQTALDQVTQQLTQIQTDVTAKQQAWYQNLEQFQTLKARYQSLKEVMQDHSGFYQGVRAVLSPQNKISGLIGAVADLLHVPTNLQFAMEQVLGSQLQQVVCEDTSSAEAAINFLKQQRLGRATFLPLTTIRAYRIDARVLQTAQATSGFVGVASELITYDAKIKNVVEHLLGNILVVAQLPEATKLAQAIHYQTRIVTLDGDILTPGGAMTGGKTKQQRSSLLNRQQELTDLQDQLKQQQTTLNDLQTEIKTAKTQSEQLSGLKTEQAQQLASLVQQNVSLEQGFNQQQQELVQLQRQIKVTELTLTRIKTEQAEMQQQLTAKVAQQDGLAANIATLKAKMATTQERLQNFTAQKEVLAEQISDLKTKLAVAENSLSSQKSQYREQQQNLRQLQTERTDLEQSLTNLNDDQQKKQIDVAAVKKQLAALTTSLTELQTKLAQLKSARQDTVMIVAKLEPQSQRQYQLQKQTAKEQEEVAVALNSLKSEMNARLTTLREDHQLTFEAAYQNLPEDHRTLAELHSDLKLVRMALRDIGHVNLAAISEFAEVNERYQFLSKQQDDLITARQEILKTMADMDQEVSQRFSETFKAINEAFTKIFPKMFGGGQAKLELTDPEHMLTTGIEINAQPPGKKLQSLSLLSGGERALTAITLLFAILKVKPAPFSILDEVEASLDDANVDRYANYLRHYEAHTQFIVITHRKGTMMQVDRLYGVAMQESGVSKIISVSLTDVDQGKFSLSD
ncbi:chromosome segregation protein SMC [Lapidilactobacillus bayanensis]|uniref:chromosome segregation protein SMC n=1 Tax=Lapidilactobacillus bayanensis TaxID=2485998 RepID=UPI000F77264B|nr:chromosome segregation protein SMC [Lapidilactobacillus bayanensis]